MLTPDSVLIVNARVFDGTGEEVVEDGAVWIEADEIRRVGPANSFADVGEDVPRLDAKGGFLMPGLVESHAHLSYFNASSLQDLDLNCGAESTTIKAVLNARTMLECGYTSAVSFGSLHNIDTVLRQHIESGMIPGPRYLACGRDVIGTAGMIDWNPDHLQLGMEGLALKADNPWEVRKVIRTVRKNGADVVKVYLDGEGMVESDLPGELSYTQEEASAAADEGRRRNLKMVCHSRSADAVKMAMRAGFHVIGHANYLDDEALDLLHRGRHEIHVTPAIHWHVGLYENGGEFGFTPDVLDGLGYKTELEESIVSVRKMREKGIKVLPGGDFGLAWTPHGTYARDLQNFVELFGFSTEEVLVAATRDAGELVDPGGRVGTLQPGTFADLLIVDGDPLTDITVLQDANRIKLVMKGGAVQKDLMGAGLGAPALAGAAPSAPRPDDEVLVDR